MCKIIFAASAMALLAGCGITSAALDRAGEAASEGVENVRKLNDGEARILIQGPCAISLGAAVRELTPREKVLAEELAKTSCADADTEPLSEEELRRILGATDAR